MKTCYRYDKIFDSINECEFRNIIKDIIYIIRNNGKKQYVFTNKLESETHKYFFSKIEANRFKFQRKSL